MSLVTLSSCDKFLDVKPDDNIYEEEVFSTERGFTKALSGVYKSMATNNLYRNALKFGALDLIVGYWTVGLNDQTSRDFINFNYTNNEPRAKIDAMWGGLYNAIHQTNIIISYLPNIEGSENYKIIAGEAYGLRAYLHLEVFKNFGPIIKKEGLNAIAIPYYLAPQHKPEKYKTAKEVLDLMEADLQKSVEFLKEDPIIKVGRTGDLNNPNVGNYNALYDRRGIRMNIYAAKALLARKSLFAGNLNEAYDRAMLVINELKESKAIRFMSDKDLENDKMDLRFSVENIFALYDNNSRIAFAENFLNNRNYTIAYANNLDKIYESGTGSFYDIRFNWGLGNYYYEYFSKFIVSADESSASSINHATHELQLINLPEMYLIAAESKEEENPAEAIRLLDEFRSNRGFVEPLKLADSKEIQQALIDEVRREYIGEGYLFSFLKRRFLPIPVTGKIVPASLEIYKLPIPQDENLYNPKP